MRLDLNDTVLVLKFGKKTSDYYAFDLVRVIAILKKVSKNEVRRLITQGGVHLYWRSLEKKEEDHD